MYSHSFRRARFAKYRYSALPPSFIPCFGYRTENLTVVIFDKFISVHVYSFRFAEHSKALNI